MGRPDRLPEETQDDRDLVERARRGDREAFGALVRRYQDPAFHRRVDAGRERGWRGAGDRREPHAAALGVREEIVAGLRA